MEESHSAFTIDGIVDFYPNKNLLKNNKNGKWTEINWPTSCCLFLLIQNHGKTVPAVTFMEYVWGRKKIVISKNTLIKNISLLRSSLTYLGIPKNLIKTINGEGYTIPLNYPINHFIMPDTPKKIKKENKKIKKTENKRFYWLVIDKLYSLKQYYQHHYVIICLLILLSLYFY